MNEHFEKKLSTAFGANLRAARAKRNIKQEELCGRANIDRSYLSKVESGNYKITLAKVYALAAALECSLDELLPDLEDVKNAD